MVMGACSTSFEYHRNRFNGYHALVWSQIVITINSDVENVRKKVKLPLCLIKHHIIKMYE
jgi:hypothetical protein